MKLPSLNDYVRECRRSPFAGAKMKKQTEEGIMWYLSKLPQFKNPVWIRFHWTEKNDKRDYDNIAFAKKFILDALVKMGKLKDDNRRCVAGFEDTFEQGHTYGVTLYIDEEVF